MLNGCVYFNTFYNAQVYFKKAEKEFEKNGRVTPAIRTSYQKTIEKCAKVLEYHPNSRYVDDALFLMGKSYYRLGEKDKSRRKYEELLEYFPKSPYREKALLELGRVLLDLDQPDSAKVVLSEVTGKYKEEVDLLIARTYFVEERYDDVLEVLEGYIPRLKNESYKKEALWLAAKSSYNLKRYDEAVEYLNQYLKLFLNSDEELEAREFLGDVFFKKGEFEKAKKEYQALNLSPNSAQAQEIQIKIALCEKGMGEIEKAKGLLKEIIDKNQSSPQRTHALYEMALILEEEDSLTDAVKLYEEASKSFGESEYKKKALNRYQALRQLVEISSTDSLEARIRLAEIYLVELHRPEEALKIYKSIVDSAGESKIAPRALYALLYIRLFLVKDDEEALNYYNLLKEKFGDSIYAKEAQLHFKDVLENLKGRDKG
ncbi:hypothetical protein DRZ77_03265 [Candidatus Woesearchaeota archaeon]|nr:MAG: hypothetical protein DRZ77_03265 [Candidatus Woesearchaeota archaeon]